MTFLQLIVACLGTIGVAFAIALVVEWVRKNKGTEAAYTGWIIGLGGCSFFLFRYAGVI